MPDGPSKQVNLVRFGKPDDFVVLDGNDIAWIRSGKCSDGEKLITVTLKCGQQFAVYQDKETALFDELCAWAASWDKVEEYEDLFDVEYVSYCVNPLSETQKAYLAAFVDADGCISIGRQMHDGNPNRRSPRYGLKVSIHQCNKSFIEMVHSMVGIGYIHAEPRGNNKTIYRWVCSGAEACDFLRVIYTHLRIKGPQADVVFRFRETFATNWGKRQVPKGVTEKREECYQEIGRLKQEIGERY